MKVTVFLSVLLCCVLGIKSLIVPDELPSLLSVIYSNIPTLKKGTDSRVGWGFRLGDRADFQIMLEIGPQQYTQPLANQVDKTARKRNTLENLANTLYAQNQDIKRAKEQTQQKIRVQSQENLMKESKSEIRKKPVNGQQKQNTDSSEWLKNWSALVQRQENLAKPIYAKPGLAIGEIDAKSVLPADDEDEVKYEKVPVSVKSSTKKPKTATAKEDALDNVDLD